MPGNSQICGLIPGEGRSASAVPERQGGESTCRARLHIPRPALVFKPLLITKLIAFHHQGRAAFFTLHGLPCGQLLLGCMFRRRIPKAFAALRSALHREFTAMRVTGSAVYKCSKDREQVFRDEFIISLTAQNCAAGKIPFTCKKKYRTVYRKRPFQVFTVPFAVSIAV